ncbi:MAG: MFS transporter [Tepidisphaeraceae bacterium]
MSNSEGTGAEKATRIRLFSFNTPQMRAFHLSWFAFFLCFFAWFGIAPLMGVVRKELQLTQSQIGNIIIASVAITILARLLVGWLLDRYGPRLTYTWVLILGSLPVMGIGLARDYESFLLFRLAIGAIGASFVITQYHTSAMFAPNCVGTANATTAGWGNVGGGAAQIVMPLLFSGLVAMGLGEFWGWRVAMIVPGAAMLLAGAAYYVFTQDTPAGNLADLRRSSAASAATPTKPRGAFKAACADRRVWALAMIYGASFGVEITIHNIAALHFMDSHGLGIKSAGMVVAAFGLLAIFARTLGGWISDRTSLRFGLSGRAMVLGGVLFGQGLLLILFSRIGALPLAVVSLILFGLFVHMACGATYALIPFINRQAVGSVAGVVGAGGNVGAVLSGFLFKGAMPYSTALLLLGVAVTACSCLALLVRFAPETETMVTDEPPTAADLSSYTSAPASA